LPPALFVISRITVIKFQNKTITDANSTGRPVPHYTRTMRLVAACLLWGCCGASAQDTSALVTFYSSGCQPCAKQLFQGVVAGSFEMAYVANFYDGSERLAHITSHRFLTFKLQPGAHTFDFKDAVKNPTKQQLNTKLDPGKHYFIRMSILNRGVYSVRVL
jgi:hypothetical protein